MIWIKVVVILASIAYYIISSMLYRELGKRLGFEDPWFAWIPIFRLWMICRLSEREHPIVWYGSLIITTFVADFLMRSFSHVSGNGKAISILVVVAATIEGLAIYAYLFMGVCERCNKPKWWAIPLLVPFADCVIVHLLNEVMPAPLTTPAGQPAPAVVLEPTEQA